MKTLLLVLALLASPTLVCCDNNNQQTTPQWPGDQLAAQIKSDLDQQGVAVRGLSEMLAELPVLSRDLNSCLFGAVCHLLNSNQLIANVTLRLADSPRLLVGVVSQGIGARGGWSRVTDVVERALPLVAGNCSAAVVNYTAPICDLLWDKVDHWPVDVEPQPSSSKSDYNLALLQTATTTTTTTTTTLQLTDSGRGKQRTAVTLFLFGVLGYLLGCRDSVSNEELELIRSGSLLSRIFDIFCDLFFWGRWFRSLTDWFCLDPDHLPPDCVDPNKGDKQRLPDAIFPLFKYHLNPGRKNDHPIPDMKEFDEHQPTPVQAKAKQMKSAVKKKAKEIQDGTETETDSGTEGDMGMGGE